jgi:hypothetical protein
MQRTPVPAVKGIVTIVAHHEDIIIRDNDWTEIIPNIEPEYLAELCLFPSLLVQRTIIGDPGIISAVDMAYIWFPYTLAIDIQDLINEDNRIARDRAASFYDILQFKW